MYVVKKETSDSASNAKEINIQNVSTFLHYIPICVIYTRILQHLNALCM